MEYFLLLLLFGQFDGRWLRWFSCRMNCLIESMVEDIDNRGVFADFLVVPSIGIPDGVRPRGRSLVLCLHCGWRSEHTSRWRTARHLFLSLQRTRSRRARLSVFRLRRRHINFSKMARKQMRSPANWSKK